MASDDPETVALSGEHLATFRRCGLVVVGTVLYARTEVAAQITEVVGLDKIPQPPASTPGAYRAARGVAPPKPGSPPAHETIRKLRDDTP